MEQKFKIGVIGLGYVGFPLACLFAKKYPVIGYDINKRRIEDINAGVDSTNEVTADALQSALANGMVCTHQLDDLRKCNVYVVAIPTPVDDFYNPELLPLKNASETVGKVLKKGDYVIYESTDSTIAEIDKAGRTDLSEKTQSEVDILMAYLPEQLSTEEVSKIINK